MGDRKENFSNVILNNPQKRNIYFALAGLAVVALVVGFYLASKNPGPAQIGGGANVANLPAVNSVPGSSTSPEYNKKVQEQNDNNATQALEDGKGFIPTPVNNSSFSKDSPIDLIDQEKERKRLEDEENRARQAAIDEEQRRKEDEARLLAAQKEQQLQQTQQPVVQQPVIVAPKKKYSMDDYVWVATASNIWKPRDTVAEFNYADGKSKGNSNSQSAPSNNQNVVEEDSPAVSQSVQNNTSGSALPLASAGTIFNAILETSINSDEPSPVLAKIVSGEFKGARLIGQMTTSGEKVIVQFTTMSLPGKSTSTKIEAVAIDPQGGRTALATDVDRHYFLRYGVLLASTFLGGYAEAIARQNTTTTVSPEGGVVVSQGELSSKDINKQAIGSVGRELANTTKTQVQDLKPTITVDGGTAIGILLMNDLIIR